MKEFYICDAVKFENQTITSYFVVSSKQVRPRKSGELYLQLTLTDRSGQLDAKMWDNVADAIDVFEQGDFIKAKGLLNRYNNKFQFTIHKLRKVEDSEIDFSDYLPKTTKDIDALWRTLGEFVATFKNPYLKALIEAFMSDPEIAAAYKAAPAAKSMHHAFIGGLLDHVVSLFQLCDLVCSHYPQVDRDLVLSGAFLHDIGKIHELQYSRAFSYSTRGQLLGHMIIELEMLQHKIPLVPGFPLELKMLLEHLIISHHGQYEFGSPKLPMFPEALLLHYLDDLDSKLESMRAHFEREVGSEAEWTTYNPSLGRPLLNSRRMLERMAKAENQPAEQATEAAAAGNPGAGTPSKS